MKKILMMMFRESRQIMALCFCLIACISCDKENDNWIDKDMQKNLVIYEVRCNTPGVPVRLSGRNRLS